MTCTIMITPDVHKLNVFAKAHVALQPKLKIMQPKNFRKVETKSGSAEKCDTIFGLHY